MAAVEPARNSQQSEQKLTNGYPGEKELVRDMADSNGFPTESNGGGGYPPGGGQGGPYGPYSHGPQGFPLKGPPGAGYPGPYGPGGPGPTPTLNSLLQDRRYSPGMDPNSPGPQPGPGGPGGPPGGSPGYPGWGYGHPGYRGQVYQQLIYCRPVVRIRSNFYQIRRSGLEKSDPDPS